MFLWFLSFTNVIFCSWDLETIKKIQMLNHLSVSSLNHKQYKRILLTTLILWFEWQSQKWYAGRMHLYLHSDGKLYAYHISNDVKRIIFERKLGVHIQVLHNMLCQNLQRRWLKIEWISSSHSLKQMNIWVTEMSTLEILFGFCTMDRFSIFSLRRPLCSNISKWYNWVWTHWVPLQFFFIHP